MLCSRPERSNQLKRRMCAMKHKRASGIVVGLAAIGLLWGAASADPGNGHGPPPGKGPKGTPSTDDGGGTNPGGKGPKGTPSTDDGGSTNPGGMGKGACVSACQHSRRDCNKAGTTDRKACYAQTCAPERAAVEACDGGGDGVSDQGGQDGVTDQGGGCDAAAHALTQCLHDCRDTFRAARQSCAQSVLGCKVDCGLPLRTPTPTPLPTP